MDFLSTIKNAEIGMAAQEAARMQKVADRAKLEGASETEQKFRSMAAEQAYMDTVAPSVTPRLVAGTAGGGRAFYTPENLDRSPTATAPMIDSVDSRSTTPVNNDKAIYDYRIANDPEFAKQVAWETSVKNQGLQDSTLDLVPGGAFDGLVAKAVGAGVMGGSLGNALRGLLGRGVAKEAVAVADVGRQVAAKDIAPEITIAATKPEGGLAEAMNKAMTFEEATGTQRKQTADMLSKMSDGEITEARAKLIGNRNTYDLPQDEYIKMVQMEAELEDRAYRKTGKTAWDDVEDQWDYTDKKTRKTYSDGMSAEEFLEMKDPQFARQWSKAGNPKLTDRQVKMIADGKYTLPEIIGYE